MDAELGSLLDDFDSGVDALLHDEVLNLPDLELLLPSSDFGDDELTALLSDGGNGGVFPVESEEEDEEEKQGLTVSVDAQLTRTPEEHETELATRELKFLEAQRDFLQFKAETNAGGLQDKKEGERAKKRMEEEKRRLLLSRRQQNMLADVMRQHKQSFGDLHRLMTQASPLMHYVS
jgi:hypothetical protein